MTLMDDFYNAKKALYDHVKFKEDWVVYPIDDATEMFWKISKDENYVTFAETAEQLESDGNFYQNSIYRQRFYDKWVYRGELLTMIIVDTHTDGNKFFQFFDNNKEVTNEKQ